MDELVITVNIADRPYRLTIARSEEEQIREACKLINDRIKNYAELYAFKDKQDLLAMSVLQFATEFVQYKGQQQRSEDNAIAQLQQLMEIIRFNT
jgi:cell division protein ZapA